MQDNILFAALAGLVHDVGRFAMLAGEKGNITGLTEGFVRQYLPAEWHSALINNQALEQRLNLAAHLAVGETNPAVNMRSPEPAVRLETIFSSLTAEEQITTVKSYWPALALSLKIEGTDRPMFPQAKVDPAQTQAAYRKLWLDFSNAMQQLADKQARRPNLVAYIEAMLQLMQTFTWSVPALPQAKYPGISLYDHQRMTSALAAVLPDSTPAEAEPVALLVGGDMSGVQDFIYTITSRGATSALRGRSFYLQLVTEAVARFLLMKLDLPISNLVYVAGGNFYLLARATDGERLKAIQREISQVFFYHHRGDLYLALAGQPLTVKSFEGKAISTAWGNLSEGLNRAKLHRFSEMGADLSALFEPQGHGGNQDQLCHVCGNEHAQIINEKRNETDSEEDGVRKCPQCVSYEALGDELRKAHILEWQQITPVAAPLLQGEAAPGKWEQVLAHFGWQVRLHAESESVQIEYPGLRLLLAFNDPDAERLKALPISNPLSVLGRRFMVNATPLITEDEITRLRSAGLKDLPHKNGIKTFEVLAVQSDGINRLGVLRMDVDNLGKLFAEGLGDRASLAGMAALSFAISLYFEGWVGVLAERHNQHDPRLYAIYSGGDDLFFVGSWDAVVELGRDICRDLAAYTAHPGIHVSGGMVLADAKYPLYQAAQDAHEAEAQAKTLIWFDGKEPRRKNAFSFMGQALPWVKFGLEDCSQTGLKSVHALMHHLRDQSGDKPQAMPLIRRLSDLHTRYRQVLEERQKTGRDLNQDGKEQTLYGPWHWLGAYQLSRLAQQRRSTNKAQAEAILALRKQLEDDDYRSIEWIGLAARWAELRWRDNRKEG